MSNNFETERIEHLLNEPDSADSEVINPALYDAIYSLGRDAQSYEEYRYALDILLNLCLRDAERVRVQSILAISILSLTHKQLRREGVERAEERRGGRE